MTRDTENEEAFWQDYDRGDGTFVNVSVPSTSDLVAACHHAVQSIGSIRSKPSPTVLLMLDTTLEKLKSVSENTCFKGEGPSTLTGIPVESFSNMDDLRAAYTCRRIEGGVPCIVEETGVVRDDDRQHSAESGDDS